MKTDELLIYQAENGVIQLKADADKNTFWATQKQIADDMDKLSDLDSLLFWIARHLWKELLWLLKLNNELQA